MATPTATKLALVGTLGLTAAVVLDYARRAAAGGELTGAYLALLGALFSVRVAGQLYARAAAPAWLPPTEQWNLLPYRLLLPIQLAFIGVIVAIVADFVLGPWVVAERNEGAGVFLIVVSFLYGASMLVRYAIRMARRPAERWFGGGIPIVFHLVLAAFLFVLGTYHASA